MLNAELVAYSGAEGDGTAASQVRAAQNSSALHSVLSRALCQAPERRKVLGHHGRQQGERQEEMRGCSSAARQDSSKVLCKHVAGVHTLVPALGHECAPPRAFHVSSPYASVRLDWISI